MTGGFSPFTPDTVTMLRRAREYLRHTRCSASDLDAHDKHAAYVELIVSGRYVVVEGPPPKTREIL